MSALVEDLEKQLPGQVPQEGTPPADRSDYFRTALFIVGIAFLGLIAAVLALGCTQGKIGSAAEPELRHAPPRAKLLAETPKVDVQLRNECESPVVLEVKAKNVRGETSEINLGPRAMTSRQFKSGDIVSMAPAQSVLVDIRTKTIVVSSTCDSLLSL
jgi:hypothetical protein